VSAQAAPAPPGTVTVGRVARLWWPLAASWMLMAVELPLLAAVVGRLPDERIHLAAYGSVVFPVSLVIEGPVIMLLAASTALCSHWEAYRKVYRFMMAMGAGLTLVHAAVAFTPLFGWVARDIMGAPEEILEPARRGLQIMTPWTWAIGYRRFQQGVLIRNEHGRAVTMGTLTRLVANATTLLCLAKFTDAPGIVVGATAIATGVCVEAIYVGLRVRPVLEQRVRHAPPSGEPLNLRSFLTFYVPLALTPLITLFIQPLGAAAMARMPASLASLAAWPAVHGLVFLTRSVGMAYNEVVVTLLGQPGAVDALRRFGRMLGATTVALLLLLAATPLSDLWFGQVSDLDPELVAICRLAVGLAVLMPGYAALQSWFQGSLVKARTTRPITEAVVLYFVLSAALLNLGMATAPEDGSWFELAGLSLAGVHWTLLAFVAAGLSQTAWLWWRSRGAVARFEAAERADTPRGGSAAV
jgi:hypothetical protein